MARRKRNPSARFAPRYVICARKGSGPVHYWTGTKFSTGSRPRYFIGLSRATSAARNLAGRVKSGITVYLNGPVSRMGKGR